MKTNKHNEELVGRLQDEIDNRSRVMWENIKALPTMTFDNTAESLRAVQEVGKQAFEIEQLRKTLLML